MNSIQTRQLDCGLTLLIEPRKNVESCSLQWVLPAGSASDPIESVGVSAMLSEMLFRGAGDLDSRALSEEMDRCGMRRDTDVGIHHLRLSATMLSQELYKGLSYMIQMVRDPLLPGDAVEPIRNLCLQSLDSLQDEPQQEVMLRVREQHRPSPFNRSGYGERDGLEAIDLECIRSAWSDRMSPHGSILAVAGAVDASSLVDHLETSLGDWSGSPDEVLTSTPAAGGVDHIERDSAQVHIGMAWNAPPESHADAMLEHVASRVFSGSSSGRLFTEVRQKRSLCYSVNAIYRSGRDNGVIGLYAGTTTERAQETLDTCASEFERMSLGVTEEEFTRAITGLESGLVLSGESNNARASSLVSDQFRLGRARSLDEILGQVSAVSLADVNDYLSRRATGEPTIVTLGSVTLVPPA